MEKSSESIEIGSKSYEIRRLVYSSAMNSENKSKDEFFEFINKSQDVRDITLSVKDDEGQLIAAIHATLCHDKADLVSVFVSDGFRRKGLGTLMLKKLEDFVKLNGGKKLLVCTFNFQAEKFYAKCGYRKIFVINDYVPSAEINRLSRVDLFFLSKAIDLNEAKSQNFDDKNVNENDDQYVVECDFGYDDVTVNWISQGIDKYSQDFIGVRPKNERNITFFIKDEENQFIAGIHALTYRGNLEISNLWIADKYRNHGIEDEMIRKVEEFCQENNLRKIYIFNDAPSNNFIKELDERGYGAICMNEDYQYLFKSIVMARLEEHEMECSQKEVIQSTTF